MRQQKTFLVLLLLSLLFSFSCKKKGQTKTEENNITQLRYPELVESAFQYESFAAKAKCTGWLNGKKQNFNANIRIKKGEQIWISMNLLGIEGTRVLISPDSIKILDKLNKKYYAKPFNYIQTYADLPLDFQGLEDLLIGNLVYIDERKFQSNKKGKEWILMSSYKQFKSRISLRESDLKPTKAKIQDTILDRKLTIDYNSYVPVESQQFSSERYVNLVAGDQAQLITKMSRIKINEEQSFPFKVSSKYERVP